MIQLSTEALVHKVGPPFSFIKLNLPLTAKKRSEGSIMSGSTACVAFNNIVQKYFNKEKNIFVFCVYNKAITIIICIMLRFDAPHNIFEKNREKMDALGTNNNYIIWEICEEKGTG